MFLATEFQRFQENEPVTLQSAHTQWSQLTPAPDYGTSRMVDILYIYPSVEKYPVKVFYLVVSDGQQYAIAVTTEQALKECGCFDIGCPMTRCAVITYTKMVPANRQTMSKPFAEYLISVNEGLHVLQVTSLVLQGRGPVLARPLSPIESPPTIETEEYDIVVDAPKASDKSLPATFTSKRAPQFAAVEGDSDSDSYDTSPNDYSCVIV